MLTEKPAKDPILLTDNAVDKDASPETLELVSVDNVVVNDSSLETLELVSVDNPVVNALDNSVIFCVINLPKLSKYGIVSCRGSI